MAAKTLTLTAIALFENPQTLAAADAKLWITDADAWYVTTRDCSAIG